MTTATHASRAAKIREALDHPIVDGDGHILELTTVFLEYLRETAGAAVADRFEASAPYARWSEPWRPDVNCVIHTHSHYAMVFATTGRVLGMYNDMSALFLDEQVVYVEDGVRPPVDGVRMCELVGDRHTVIIKNHGAIFLGDSIETTTVEAFTFEKCARIQLEAEMIGGTEHVRAYAEHSKQAYRRYYRPQMWAAAVRRLRRDDPALFIGRENLIAVE